MQKLKIKPFHVYKAFKQLQFLYQLIADTSDQAPFHTQPHWLLCKGQTPSEGIME